MIVTFTDFGVAGPYVGQMHAVLAQCSPGIPIIDLMRDAPSFDPKASAYLLAPMADEFPDGTVFLCVVDPGVGGTRLPLIVEAGGRWYVGPGNGLFEMVVRRATGPVAFWEIVWRPQRLSASFHGRDLFAPIAVRLANGERPEQGGWARKLKDIDGERRPDWPDDLPAVIYIDGYGNAVTGIRWSTIDQGMALFTMGQDLQVARTFSDVPSGAAFCYENAIGLVEIAVNMGHAADLLGLFIGSQATFRNS